MFKYNEEDLNIAAKNSYATIGHLLVVLKNLDGDLGGPKDEIEDWISTIRDMENVIECIMEMSE